MAVIRLSVFVCAARKVVIARQSNEEPSISSPVPHHRCGMRRSVRPISSQFRVLVVMRSNSSWPLGTSVGRDDPETNFIPLTARPAQVHVLMKI